MQRIVRNGELFHGEQKANSHNSGKKQFIGRLKKGLVEVTR